MSRVAKIPVSIPTGTEVKINDKNLTIKGKLGELSQDFDPNLVKISVENNEISIATNSNSKQANAISGTLRSLINNMVKGVSEGFEKKLQLIGVGYRAQAQGDKLNLSLGFSHPVVYQLPNGISAQTPSQTEIVISGNDKQKVGQVAAEIRSYRRPEPYKGKGVRYADEYVAIKETTKK